MGNICCPATRDKESIEEFHSLGSKKISSVNSQQKSLDLKRAHDKIQNQFGKSKKLEATKVDLQ